MPRYSRKRRKRFQGNQHTIKLWNGNDNDKDVSAADQDDIEMPCASSRRLIDDHTLVDNEDDNYNIMINFLILQSVLSKFAKCPLSCNQNPKLCNDLSKKHGFCYSWSLRCGICGWKHEFETSKTTPSSGGRPFNSINLQTVIAFREMGKGYHSMCTFTSMMNMPPPMRANAYDKINDTLYTVYNNVAEQSMHNAAEETRHSLKHDIAAGEIINTGVTVDGALVKTRSCID